MKSTSTGAKVAAGTSWKPPSSSAYSPRDSAAATARAAAGRNGIIVPELLNASTGTSIVAASYAI
ncbi:hypothetical protein [Intrasporangium calvum]|uniref:hypothetical protein n=1 Tax=Intrasporangium calvum TaxID=53358 RepID=UPI0011D1A9BC|nr:hypothetical protein [Intrasporangium calvum]